MPNKPGEIDLITIGNHGRPEELKVRKEAISRAMDDFIQHNKAYEEAVIID